MRRSILWTLCLGIACTSVKESADRPNILFIMSDDHTAQAWGLYGGVLQEFAQNENIKRIADRGTVLENVFCTNSICVPSRASILTGQYSHQNGVYTLSDTLQPSQPHIGKVLQQSGYETAVVGKWHLKSRPEGFSHWEVLPGQGLYQDPILRTRENWDVGGRAYAGFSADVIADLSLDWLEDRDPDKPFFLMTHFKATHEPFDYPDRLKDLYTDVTFPEPESLYDYAPATNGRSFIGQKLWILGQRWIDASAAGDNARYPGLPFDLAGLDQDEQRSKIYQKFVADFLRSGAAIDENIGRMLDYLEDADLLENTVVIYTSDQGYFLGEHGMFDKRMMYEQALRMPFVISYPKEVPSGQRLDDIILNIDFPALFADYAEVPAPSFVQGESFRNNLRGSTNTSWRQDLYYRYWLHREERPAHFGLRTDRYKLIFYYGLPINCPPIDTLGNMMPSTPPAWEFYDLKEDPDELHNAYDQPQYQETIDTLKTRLQQLRTEWGDTDSAHSQLQEILRKNWTKPTNL